MWIEATPGSVFLIPILLLLLINSSIAIEQSCSCDGGGGGVTYTAVSDSGCREYIMDPPGAATGTMTCPSDLIWDTTACTCNFASQATCASGCQAPRGTTPPATTPAVQFTCPDSGGYEYNPFSNTCFRVIDEDKDWDDAVTACANDGEYLAVLDTLETIAWFKHLRHTIPSWRDAGRVWVGGKLDDGLWRWFGRLATNGGTEGTPILVADWESIMPNGNGNCIQLFDNRRAGFNALRENYKWDDFTCSSSISFVCERTEDSNGGGNLIFRANTGSDNSNAAQQNDKVTSSDSTGSTSAPTAAPLTELFSTDRPGNNPQPEDLPGTTEPELADETTTQETITVS